MENPAIFIEQSKSSANSTELDAVESFSYQRTPTPSMSMELSLTPMVSPVPGVSNLHDGWCSRFPTVYLLIEHRYANIR